MSAAWGSEAEARRPAAATVYPSRHREAEARGRRLGRPLRLAGRVHRVDEELMDRIGRAFLRRDEVGAELARAMRLPSRDPDRVGMATFRRALADGVRDDDPPALRSFFARVEVEPDWLSAG